MYVHKITGILRCLKRRFFFRRHSWDEERFSEHFCEYQEDVENMPDKKSRRRYVFNDAAVGIAVYNDVLSEERGADFWRQRTHTGVTNRTNKPRSEPQLI
jgi:hypothetical protein